MPDTIYDITFNDVTFTEGSDTGTLSGTIEVDYNTGTVTGQLTGAVDGGNNFNFTSFNNVTNPFGDFFSISSQGANDFVVSYENQNPTALATVTLASGGVAVNVPPGSFTSNSVSSTQVCFAAGTLIRTPRGDVPVETLKAGDVVVTASGELRPVKWIGHRDLDLRSHPNPGPAFPVRIAQGAFGPNRPSQDLYVSTGHSICIDLCGEVLVPASNLVNGATITQVEVEEISYWHVELDSHDILLANNLPAESYFVHGNRAFFEEAGGSLDALDEGRTKTHADFCRPVVLDGPVLDFVRRRLIARAEAVGWTRSFETDLHLMVDGEVRRPLCEGDAAVFLLPAGARDVRLKSNTFVPALLGRADPRSLGLSLVGLVVSNGRGEARSVSLDDERLKNGLHPEEARDGVAWRWTKGELVLSSDIWAGLAGPVTLAVTHNSGVARHWVSPPNAVPAAQSHENKPKLYAVA